MGKRIMGRILGMGPQRGMGTYYIYGVCSGIAPKDAATIAQAHSVPYIYGSGILHNHHDLLWRELLLGWNAQLCLIHKQISYINVPFNTRTIMKVTVQNYLYI